MYRNIVLVIAMFVLLGLIGSYTEKAVQGFTSQITNALDKR